MGFSSSGGAKVGTIEMWGGDTAPDGYLICDGGAISRTIYKDLFDAIGTTYGTGDGSTTFNLPNYSSARMVTSSTVSVKGNGMTLGLTKGTLNGGLEAYAGSASTGLVVSTGSYGTNAGSAPTTNYITSANLGVTTDPTKSGITGTTSLASSCKFIIKY